MGSMHNFYLYAPKYLGLWSLFNESLAQFFFIPVSYLQAFTEDKEDNSDASDPLSLSFCVHGVDVTTCVFLFFRVLLWLFL